MKGVWAAWLLLGLGAATGAPPSPAGTKRSIEDIQFGNQQNPPVSLLDDNALPGAFPSSETSEESMSGKEGRVESQEQQQEQQQQQEQEQQQEEERQQEEQLQQEETQEEDTQQEDEERGLAPPADPSSWHVADSPRLYLYQPHWRVPVVYPARRRRSVQHRAQHPDPRKVPQVSLKVLRAGQRHKRDLRRYRRDLGTGVDLEKLLANADLAELLALLPQHLHRNQGGYGTVSYAPAPPRYAPQPKLFPDYDDEDDINDEGGMGLLRQNIRAGHLPEAVMVPAGGRVWRRSGYSLSSVPGFKRSAFRANKPRPPPPQALSERDVYSLAAMLGAELDPATHRLRRAAM